MKLITYFFVTLLLCLGNSLSAQLIQGPGAAPPLPVPIGNQLSPSSYPTTPQGFGPVTCSPDSVQYTLNKATGLQFVSINNATSALATAQYFNAPQAMTIYGYEFFARATTLPNVNVTCQLFLAGADSLPTGAALASTVVGVDSLNGPLSTLREFASFASPVTVSQPYVVVFTNNSANPVSLVFSDNVAGDGGMEWLGSYNIGGTWLRSYDITLGGAPADMDAIIHPLVGYTINADYTYSPGCLPGPNTNAVFTNGSSPVFFDRMYSVAEFINSSRLSFTWNFGDASPTVNAVDTNHVYATTGPFTAVLTDTLFGWTSLCTADTSFILSGGPSAAFTSSNSGLTTNFTDASLGSPTSWAWDFGDGSTSTAQDPSHLYASAGTYTVCLVASNGICSDTVCVSNVVGTPTTSSCGPDTVQYTFNKATGLQFVSINNATSALATSQYFNAPQPITIYGYEFFARATTLPNVNVTCEIFLAGADSLPTGAPLASTIVGVDSLNGPLSVLQEFAGFSTPVTVTQPYLVVFTNNSADPVSLVFSDNVAGDGQGEFLGNYNIGGTWLRSYDITLGGNVADMDAIINPLVGYDINSSFSFNPACLPGPNTNVAFTNNSSPIFFDRMYSVAEFINAPGLSFTWNFGDASPLVNAVDTNHTYATTGPFTAVLTDTLFGWTSICTTDTSVLISPGPSAAFTSSTTGLTTNFTDASLGNPTSWAWDFGDGATSTAQDPSHTYAGAGTFTVCLVASNGSCSDTVCVTNIVGAPTTSSCGPDTVQYTFNKATGLQFVSINNTTSALATSQYFNAPQPITIFGYEFFARATTLPNVNVTCEIFLAGADSLPTGAPLASTIVGVDSLNGPLSVLQEFAAFSSPITVTQPYLVVFTNNSANPVSLVFSDNVAGDGQGEFLGNYNIGGTWLRSYDITLGGNVADMDAILNPLVGYDIVSNYNFNPACLPGPNTNVTFTNNSSPVFFDRMYSVAEFINAPGLSFTWNFGDASPLVNAVDTNHTYATGGPFTAVLTDTLFGWTSICTTDTSFTLNPGPSAAFTFTTAGLGANFTDASLGNPTSWAWDFGDGNGSTSQDPTHTYAAPGVYTVCLVASNGSCTDTICQTAIVGFSGCGPDTVQYTLNKATSLQFVQVNNATSASATSQYFNAPQPITIYGYEFFGRATTLPSVNVTCEIFLAGADSLPTGAPLASAVVAVDSLNGPLSVLREFAGFSTPVTVTQPYLVVLTNNSANNVSVVFNDHIAGDGGREWLSNFNIGGNWLRSYDVTLGTDTANMDVIFHPVVGYQIAADYAFNPACLPGPNTNVTFNNNSSPIFFDRMYSVAEFINSPGLSFTWNFGDATPLVNAVDTNHTYATGGPFTAVLTDTLFGWTSICTADTSFTLNPGPVAAFTHTTSSLSASFTDASLGAPTSWAWDFGDGNGSTLQNPNHTYTAAGAYTVCLVASNGVCSDTACETVVVGTSGCGPDSIQYALNKASSLQFVQVNNATSASAASQYFNAPQAITIFGYEFFARATTLPSVDVTCEIFLAGADSLPTGAALASAVVSVDSLNGPLSVLREFAGFSTPVTVTQPYLVVFTNNSADNVSLVFNDHIAGDGGREWLSNFNITGNWLRSYDVFLGADTANMDVILHPLVGYDLTADYTFNPSCLANPNTTATFTNNSSPVLFDRMYNVAEFINSPELSFTWDFGDASPQVNAVDTSHTYATTGPFTAVLTDTLFGWTSICTADTSMIISGTQVVSNFTVSSSLFTANFTDASTGSPIAWFWDFGDGNTSTVQNPAHTYASAGTYTVCLTVSDSCGADSSCQSVVITCTPPSAAFTSTSNLFAANFTDASTSSNTIGSYFWDFGDGNTSTVQNPAHTYASAGTYTVCLTVSDSCGTDSTCQSVVITCTPPTAAFTSTSNLFAANFTDASTSSNTIGSYFWDFGDGNTSTVQNPAHTYASAGTYTVCLTVSDSCGTDSTCQSVVITCNPPTAAFTATSTELTASFTDASTSSNSITGYLWDFGDGNTSTAQNPSHTYAATGTYTVCLTVSDTCGSDSSCQSVVITCTPPTAAFTSTSNLFTASFTDASTSLSTISGYLWDFGDGNTSTTQNPSHTYAAAGTYTVCLTVTDSCGSDSSCQSVVITCNPPSAAFTATSTEFTASFTDASTSSNSITSYLWDFGDGNTSTTQNPSHTYAATGTYTVCLTVTDTCGSDSSCQSVVITCTPPTAAFTSTSNLFTASFTDASTSLSTISGYLWDFGDGNTSTTQNPSHTYAAAGTYTVCLTVTDSCGSDSSCQSVVITCTPPTAAYTFTTNLLTADFTDASTSSNTIGTYLWDLGDGNTSTAQNPSHTYAAPGTYTVCLTVTDTCGTDSVCQSVVITCVPPTAAYTFTTNLLTADFTDASTSSNTIGSYLWDLGDGNTSTLQNPSHTYAAPGTYTVCLTVTDSCGTDSVCQSVVITCVPPTAAFTIGSSFLTINFTDASTSSSTIGSYAWDFGDGNTSTLQNPTHTYATPGNYLACLTVSDSCGSDSTCIAFVVSCEPPTAGFTSSDSGLIVTFTDTSLFNAGSGIATWSWTFGDGNSSTSQNPVHTYQMPGSYQVCLTVDDSCGTSTFCDSVTVDTLVGVEPGVLAGVFNVFPNPTQGQLNIEYELPGTEPALVKLYSIYGQELRSMMIEPQRFGKAQMNLSDLSEGTYILKISVGNGSQVKRISVIR